MLADVVSTEGSQPAEFSVGAVFEPPHPVLTSESSVSPLAGVSAAGVSQALLAAVVPEVSGCQLVSTPVAEVSAAITSDDVSSLDSGLPAAANWIRLKASMVRRLSNAFLVDGRNRAPFWDPFRESGVTTGGDTCAAVEVLEEVLVDALGLREIAGLEITKIRWDTGVPREIGLIVVDAWRP